MLFLFNKYIFERGVPTVANQDVRFKARAAGVAIWRIADYLGVSEMTVNRRLRKELNPEQKKVFLDAIQAIAAERAKQALDSAEGE